MIHLVLAVIAMYVLIYLIDGAIGLLHAWCIMRERERAEMSLKKQVRGWFPLGYKARRRRWLRKCEREERNRNEHYEWRRDPNNPTGRNILVHKVTGKPYRYFDD